MPANVTPDPFVIQPDDDLLARRPDLRRAARQLASIYANGRFASDETLKAIGEGLYNALALDGALDVARKRAGAQILPLRIETDRADIQQLPWETLHHPDFGFLGLHDGFTLSRGAPATAVDLPTPESGPLKVLLFTSLPDDLDAAGRLDIEEEQAQVLEALTPLIADGRVLLEMPDDGRFATLTDFIHTFQPHLVFLSGHGKYVNEPFQEADPFALFLCENDHGGSHAVHEKELATAFLGSRARCVVLSACESGMTASDALTTGLMGSLHGAGLPHVIGMRESVLDRAGTLFARAFIDATARQERVDVALQAGRQAITTPLAGSPWLAVDSNSADGSGLAEQSLGQWSLPVLLSRDPAAPLIDWNFIPEPPPHRLPSKTLQSIPLPPRFIGRRSELRNIKSRLRQNRLHQLLITGPGGQGKTALAGRIAEDLQRRGYLILAYAARPENIWQQFFISIMKMLNADNRLNYTGMDKDGFLPTEEDKATFILELLLTQYQRKVVLFFDNLESVQDEQTQALSDARLAAWIAAAQSLAAQGLILLLTSRWLLPGWPQADESSSVHLSLARANYGDFLQMARPQLPLHLLARRDWLRQVYDTLHGNGRGLTFFAAAVQAMDSDDEADFLASLKAAEAQTQTDMALAAIVSHLDDPARALLQRLRVYSAPVPVEGVVKIGLDLPAPEDHLRRLLAVSLVEMTANHRWQCREYQLPPLVTAWLRAQPDAPPPAPTHRRQAARYWRYLFDHERRDLTTAITTHQALHAAAETEAAHRLALDHIVGRLSQQGLYQTLLDVWLPPTCTSENLQTRGRALNLMGLQNDYLGNYAEALDYYERSLKISQEIGDKSGEGATLNNISQIYDARGDYTTALDFLQRSLKISQEIGDKSGEGTTLNNISQIYDAQGDYTTALDFLQRSLKIQQEIGDKSGEGTTLNNISQIFKARGDYTTALDFLQRSLKIQQEIGDKSGEGTTLNNISQIFKARGDYTTALDFLQRSLKIRQEIGDKSGEGTTLNNISQIFKARGDYTTALDFLQRSLKIQQEIGDKYGEGTTLNNMATTAHAQGDYTTALDFLQRSLKIQQEIGDKSGEGTTLNNISQIFKARGDYTTALDFLQRSLKIRQEIGDKSGEGTTLNNISQIYDARGDYTTALDFLQRSLKIQQEIGDKSGEGTTLNNISQIYDARGDYTTALDFLQRSLKIQQEIGDKSGEGATLNNMATTAHARGDYTTALDFLQRSLKISQEIGDKYGEGTTLNNISQIYDARGDYTTALDFLQRSLKIQQEIGDKSGEGTTLNNISQIFKARGDYTTALDFLQRSLKIRQEIGDKSGEGTTLNNISQIYDARGDYTTALDFLQRSLKIQQEIGDTAGLCATLFNMGHIHLQNEEVNEALSAWVSVYQIASQINLAQALQALEGLAAQLRLAEQLGVPPGLAGWAALAQQMQGNS